MLLIVLGILIVIGGFVIDAKARRGTSFVSSGFELLGLLVGLCFITIGLVAPGIEVYEANETTIYLKEVKYTEANEPIYLVASEVKSITGKEFIESTYMAKSKEDENIQLSDNVEIYENVENNEAKLVIVEKKYKRTIWTFALIAPDSQYTFYIPEGGVEKTVYLK